jgi:hypothetical protein
MLGMPECPRGQIFFAISLLQLRPQTLPSSKWVWKLFGNLKGCMSNISVATYSISVSKRFSRAREPISNFDNADLLDVILRFLKARKSPVNDEETKHLIRMGDPKIEGRQICGLVETGDYGYSSEGFDTEKEKVSYHRRPMDADLKPFFYLFDLPKDETRGLIALQRFKTFGIRKLLMGDFAVYFQKLHPEYSVRTEPILHPKLLKQFTDDGTATKIRLRKFHIPKDVCDAMNNRIKPEDGYVEYSIIAKKGGSFNKIKDLFGANSQLFTVEPGGFTPDKALVEVTLNGRKRTLDISDLNKLRTYFDITGEVEMSASGHPKFESIRDISKGILVDIWPVIKGASNAE